MTDPEERLRMALREEAPPALDADAIIHGARRHRAARRLQVAAAAAGLVVVTGGVVTAVNVTDQAAQEGSSAAAPAAPAERRADASTSPGSAHRTVGPQAPQAGRDAPVVDGLALRVRADGFCVVPPAGPPVCRTGPGAVAAPGATRRWVIHRGPRATHVAQYASGDRWLPMTVVGAGSPDEPLLAYAPDPVGDGPFRVRQVAPDGSVARTD
ncbi:hypothetical protein [Mariniluteicoccus flavus]